MKNKTNFKFASATCGFKKTKKPDLAVIFSPVPCTYSGVFTSNQVRAACVDENKSLLKKRKRIRAIVVNSGNANACTGKKGILAVKGTQKIAAKLLNINPDEILVASTGSIGIELDMEKMKKGLFNAVPKLDSRNFPNAAKAILTTDRYAKTVSRNVKDFYLLGFTKGAGMIHPNMATMLCFFFTNLNASQQLLQSALKEAVNNSFNNISVDGDISTNDMVIVLSNNQSKKKIVSEKDSTYLSFKKVLNESCLKLAKEIVLDGEGANRLIDIRILGAKSKKDANEIARFISTSMLFKSAIFGADPNWGRAAARVGATSVKINQEKLDIYLNSTQVFKKGSPLRFDRDKLNKQIKKSKEVKLTVNLNLGKQESYAFGCDLSTDYVKFNSAYFT